MTGDGDGALPAVVVLAGSTWLTAAVIGGGLVRAERRALRRAVERLSGKLETERRGSRERAGS